VGLAVAAVMMGQLPVQAEPEIRQAQALHKALMVVLAKPQRRSITPEVVAGLLKQVTQTVKVLVVMDQHLQ